jgi:aspartyl-tRNA(Asn)/glutamyl-tRNA(Gln) amidotransferase subunit B
MRCDANVSLRPVGHTVFGTRAEVKNMNSVRSLGRAIEYEIARQTDRLTSGERIIQETRHWNEAAGTTSTLRVKETTEDYRYFPDPDLVPVQPTNERIEEVRSALPELPAATRTRLRDEHGITAEQAATLVSLRLADRFTDAVAAGAPPVDAANWLSNEVVAWCNERAIEPITVPLDGAALAELTGLVADGTLSKALARKVLEGVLAGEGSPREVADARGLAQISDTDAIAEAVDAAIADQPEAAQKVRDGNDKAIGALVGAVMRSTKGQANPAVVNELLRARLSGG